MKTITPVLWSRLTKNNEKKIYIRVTENRKSIYQSLGVSINPKLWLDHSGRVSKSHPDHDKINELIEDEIKKIQSKDIRRTKSKSYLDYHKNYQDDLKENNKFGSYKKFNTVYKHLELFQSSLGKADITFDDIDKAFLTKLKAFFTKKHIGNNSQRTYFKQIRLLLTEAIKEELYQPLLPLEVIFPTIPTNAPGPKSLSKSELYILTEKFPLFQ
ncbi:MAG: phage integrase SAM-like domain-containing protein, partial [Bacteroidetes bacterium]|nr:phage integrase SAM-like domain-containing protein [Bacteroidota bacterium]